MAASHIGTRPDQRAPPTLLLCPKEGDLDTVGQVRFRQQPRQFERDADTGAVVVGPGATGPALGIKVRPDQNAPALARVAPQPDHVAGDAVVAAQGDPLLQVRLIAQRLQPSPQVRRRPALSRRPGGTRPDALRQIPRCSQRARAVEIITSGRRRRGHDGRRPRLPEAETKQARQNAHQATAKHDETQRLTPPLRPAPRPAAGAAGSGLPDRGRHPSTCRSVGGGA